MLPRPGEYFPRPLKIVLLDTFGPFGQERVGVAGVHGRFPVDGPGTRAASCQDGDNQKQAGELVVFGWSHTGTNVGFKVGLVKGKGGILIIEWSSTLLPIAFLSL